VSFEPSKIAENAQELINTLVRMKPATAKGIYLKGVSMASTMSPGITIDAKSLS
jgi:large subunit ribosomal protein L1